MRQAGRYMQEYRKIRSRWSIKEISKNPELCAEVTLQPVAKLEVDAAIIFSDILLLAEPLGFRFDYAKAVGPVFQNPILGQDDVDRLPFFDVREKMDFMFRALKLVKKKLPDGIALVGFAGAPFTLASYLIEGGHSDHYLKTKELMHQNPKAWQNLMEKLTRLTADYLAAQAASGADVVQIFDSWAGCLSAHDYEEFVLSHNQTIVNELKKRRVPVIYFSTGTTGYPEIIKKTGADVISVDWRTSLAESWRRLGYDAAIQGNLDPALLRNGPVKAIVRQTQKILQEANKRPGHIFNLGHGILPDTPVEHARAVVAAVKQWK